ncbi:hypothetical protein IFM5058_09694 [Aspergillus udagawae]|nr:hypothetical protein IFM5058_09694 [Aspergillus udagawae]
MLEEQTANGKVQRATNAMVWQEKKGGAEPDEEDGKRVAQGAVEGAVQDTTESTQTIADAALQTALQQLQAGQEVQKAVRKAARDAVEDGVSKIGKTVQDNVTLAAEVAMPAFETQGLLVLGGMMDPGIS